jgi:general secretion pathway protein K
MSYLYRLKNRKSRQRQQGVVIVVALFIVALVATMAYWMMARLERDTQRTSLLLRDTQAEFYAQGSIAWAMDQLRNDWGQRKPNQIVDAMPMQSPEDTRNGYTIHSTIYDMQARFNLNNLSNPAAQIDFLRLLQAVNPKFTLQQNLAIVNAATDWILSNALQSEYSQYYLALNPSYRAAHRLMVSVNELKQVKGVTPALYETLRPYVTVLPTTTLLNVQTAPAPVLTTLSPAMSMEIAHAIELARAQNPPVSNEAFFALDPVKNSPINKDNVTVVSRYFLVETEVSIEKQHTVLYTLLDRNTDGGKVVINLIWQSKGTW